jgi:hypothetical protein
MHLIFHNKNTRHIHTWRRWRSITAAESLLIGRGVLLTTTRKIHCSNTTRSSCETSPKSCRVGRRSKKLSVRHLRYDVRRNQKSVSNIGRLSEEAIARLTHLTVRVLSDLMSEGTIQWNRLPFDRRRFRARMKQSLNLLKIWKQVEDVSCRWQFVCR